MSGGGLELFLLLGREGRELLFITIIVIKQCTLKSRYISIHVPIVPIVPTSRYNVGTKTQSHTFIFNTHPQLSITT